ncbi:helix-turn-helix transcriptional regulator [Myroides sp. WP-1]|uniref:helix-turn-helix transcriptional regulator n=1 Tax=Myroides sp. WP-1 TaxID=2759944 RepID=UPI0015F8147F|nr:AraC family transcriptional regulator [Myroides sp. WP-1]MBB1138196.1 helix-turn-helix transcriptional regulator [Myroides sp. WP-1]
MFPSTQQSIFSSSTSSLLIEQHHIAGQNYQMDISVIQTPLARIKHGMYTAEEEFYHEVLPTKASILSCSCLYGSSLTLNHDNLNIQQQGSLLFQEQAVPYQHLMQPDKNKKGEFLEIAVDQTFITTLFAEEKDYLGELLGKKSSKLSFNLNVQSLQVLHQMIANPYQGKLAQHYLDNKIEEMYLLQYAHWSYQKKQQSSPLHKRDEEAIHEVKRLITTHYNTNFTLTELAHKVGINQTKLKQGFMYLFGTTTFKYIHDLRMQKALEMIQSQAYTIYEIAEFVGYKHSHHFTTAFKKYYGKVPTQVKT